MKKEEEKLIYFSQILIFIVITNSISKLLEKFETKCNDQKSLNLHNSDHKIFILLVIS